MRRWPNVGLLLGQRRRRGPTANQLCANVSCLLGCELARECDPRFTNKNSNNQQCGLNGRTKAYIIIYPYYQMLSRNKLLLTKYKLFITVDQPQKIYFLLLIHG